jgi:hypothetical protein
MNDLRDFFVLPLNYFFKKDKDKGGTQKKLAGRHIVIFDITPAA